MKRSMIVSILAIIFAGVVVFTVAYKTRFDFKAYVIGQLDVGYKGIVSEEYIRIVNNTEEELKLSYEINIDYLVNSLTAEFKGMTDEDRQAVKDNVIEICKGTRYTADNEQKQDKNTRIVPVTITPVLNFQNIINECRDYADRLKEKSENNEFEGMSGEDLDKMKKDEYLAILSRNADTIVYGKDVTVKAVIKRYADGHWEMPEECYKELNNTLILQQ